MNWKCFWGCHDWTFHSVTIFGIRSWGIWEVVGECVRCGETFNQHITNRKEADRIQAIIDEVHTEGER